jgi:hypothetical protein
MILRLTYEVLAYAGTAKEKKIRISWTVGGIVGRRQLSHDSGIVEK